MGNNTYYKAVRPDGTDFYTGTVQWAPPDGHEGEWIVSHPTATKIGGDASEYLSVSTVATDCIGIEWPCRLLEVEAVGDITAPSQSKPNRRAGLSFRVTGELPAHEVFGPQCVHVVALIEQARHLTPGEVSALDAAPDVARVAAEDAAWDAVRVAAEDAVRVAAEGAARDAARDAAWGAVRVAAEDAVRVAALDAAWDAAFDVAGVAALNAAWDAARDAALHAAWDAARDAALDAAMDDGYDAAWDAARGAVWALVIRDVITTDHYDTLTRAWRTTIGPIHPDDPELPPRA